MTLRQLSLTNFRNIQSVTLDFHSKNNIIYGDNASGKSSLLEAISLLCQGRSFRTLHTDQCIKSGESDFLLFGQFNTYKIGFSRFNQQTRVRIDNETIHKISSIAKLQPLRIIDSNIFELLKGSPKYRREFLDWYLFHVKPSYQALWLKHKHALKQRNALLKHRKDLNQLDYWDKLFAEYCIAISKSRKKHLDDIGSILCTDLNHLVSDFNLSLNFEQGWGANSGLLNQLKAKRDRDIKYGYTSLGSHRDDIKVMSDDLPATQNLSRGYLKRLCMALLLAQLILLMRSHEKMPIVLIDDLYSELDQTSINRFLNHFVKLDLQLFVTNIFPSYDLFAHFQEYRLFHVEHGMIKPVRNS